MPSSCCRQHRRRAGLAELTNGMFDPRHNPNPPQFCCIKPDWWFQHLWKIWFRQFGWWLFPIYGNITNHVPNHQPRNLLNSEMLCGVLPLGCDLRIKSSSLFDMRAKGQCLALGLGARLLCCVLGRSRVENASESWDKPSWLSWSAWQIKFHGFCGTISYRDLDGILQYVHHPAYPAMPCNSAIGDWMTSELSEPSELSTSAKHRHFSSSNAAPWADGFADGFWSYEITSWSQTFLGGFRPFFGLISYLISTHKKQKTWLMNIDDTYYTWDHMSLWYSMMPSMMLSTKRTSTWTTKQWAHLFMPLPT